MTCPLLQVLNVVPRNKDVLVRLTHLWRLVSRHDRAMSVAEAAVQFYPKDPLLRELLADCLRCTLAH